MSILKESVNAFVASTPLQLISCMEARHHYRLEGRCLLVVACPDNDATVRQMACLMEYLAWPASDIIYLSKKSFYFRLGRVFRGLQRYRLQRLFVGNKASWIHEAFYKGLGWDQLFFVDDGVATITHYHRLLGGEPASRISTAKRVLLSAMGIRLNRPLPVQSTFFSCFALPSNNLISVDTHGFPVFRNRFVKSVTMGNQPTVGFLGQPFKGEEYLDRLRLQLSQVIEMHPGHRLVYFMHRKESRERLEGALESMPVDIELPDMPIEVVVARADRQFSAFYSFISTALFTLKTIFPELQLVQINDREMAARIPYYEEVVTLFYQAGVEKMDLDPASVSKAPHTC